MEAGAGEVHEETTVLKGFKLAFLDPIKWALVWCMGMSKAMGSTVNFFPWVTFRRISRIWFNNSFATRTIVSTMGNSRNITLLLTAPPYVLAAIVFYIISYISDISSRLKLMIWSRSFSFMHQYKEWMKTLTTAWAFLLSAPIWYFRFILLVWYLQLSSMLFLWRHSNSEHGISLWC